MASSVYTCIALLTLPYYQTYIKSVTGQDIDSDTAREKLVDFVTQNEEFTELSDKPRIILCSEDFSTELITTLSAVEAAAALGHASAIR